MYVTPTEDAATLYHNLFPQISNKNVVKNARKFELGLTLFSMVIQCGNRPWIGYAYF